MNTSLQTIQILAQSLGWTLLYSLWQGFLIAAGLFIVIKILGTRNAKLKYGISLMALAGMFLWFINTFITQWQNLQGETVYITENNGLSATAKALPVHIAANTLGNTGIHLNDALAKLQILFPYLVFIYFIGIAFMLFRFGINIIQLNKLKKEGLTNIDRQWEGWISKTRQALNISRSVALYLSDKIDVPMVMGTLKPIILLPIATMNYMSVTELETILVHELAHIKRNDYLLNIFQTVVETIMFYNPFMWWLSAVIRREREHCCDELVVASTNQPLSYAKALATLESYRVDNKVLALAATGHKNQLFNRIKRVMEMKKIRSITASWLSR